MTPEGLQAINVLGRGSNKRRMARGMLPSPPSLTDWASSTKTAAVATSAARRLSVRHTTIAKKTALAVQITRAKYQRMPERLYRHAAIAATTAVSRHGERVGTASSQNSCQ